MWVFKPSHTLGIIMKCEKCGNETGAKWKKLCSDCYKKQEREQENRNYLNAWKSGNIQNDMCYAEDNFDLD